MNNPLNANEVRFWLRFNSLNNPNWYQIVEPIGFDGAEFVIEQEPKRFARSIRYGAIDKLKFVDKFGQETGVQQTINPRGDVSTKLDYGLQWLLYIYNQFGFEMDVEFKITIGNTDFVIYSLDANDKDLTDRYTYFQCKLIDNSKTMDYKRRMDDKLNAFGTKDIFENTITPIQSFNYLKRATPISQRSIFKSNFTPTSALSVIFYTGVPLLPYSFVDRGANNANVTEDYEIDNTLGYISNEYATTLESGFMVPVDSNNFTYLEALNDLTNITIDVKNIVASSSAIFTNDAFLTAGTGAVKLLVVVGNDLRTEPFDAYTLWSRNFSKSNPSGNVSQAVPSNLSLNLPFIERGKRVYIYFTAETTKTTSGSPTTTVISVCNCSVAINSLEIEINATSTSLDVVTKAVRYSDLIKHYNKMVWNLPYFAPHFDVGGKHYNQAVFNKFMVSQNIDNLYFSGKEIVESLEEVACDVEISDQEFFIGEYPDYYTNDEIFVGTVLPSEEFSVDTNDRFACNKFIYNYTNFAQDRDLSGTSLSIHTQSEFKLQNNKVEDRKEVKNDFVRDYNETQNIVDLEINKPTTSTEQDFKKCIEDMVQLPPASFGIINGRYFFRQVSGNLEILNRSLDSSTENVVLNWSTQGMVVGQQVEILNGSSAGIYNIISITNSVLVIAPTFPFVVIADGNYFLRLKHFYSGVQWQTRTNQGFSVIRNLPIACSNLRYTIKRNILNYWSKYIATMLLGSKKDIINAFFKSNGIAETQLTTESTPIIENAPITYASLPTPILTQNLINLTVVSEFSEQIALLSTYQTGFPSRLTSPRRKGFGRFLDIKGNVIFGYIQKSAFNISTNQFTVTIEERYEPSLATVTVNGSTITVNDRTYQLSGNLDWFKTENDFIKFFDINNKPISNFYRFDFVNLNGVVYTSIGDLIMALNALI